MLIAILWVYSSLTRNQIFTLIKWFTWRRPPFQPPKWVRSPQNCLFQCNILYSPSPSLPHSSTTNSRTSLLMFLYHVLSIFCWRNDCICAARCAHSSSCDPRLWCALCCTTGTQWQSCSNHLFSYPSSLPQPLQLQYGFTTGIPFPSSTIHRLFFLNFQHWTAKMYLQWMDLYKRGMI